MNNNYLDTVRLLIDIAPPVFDTDKFAMKGGTAINLFLQDLPPLSVDIDVVFTDHTMQRDEALQSISNELARSKAAIEKMGYEANFTKVGAKGKIKGDDVKLTAISAESAVKVEVNYVFRGTLLRPDMLELVPKAQGLFNKSISVPVLQKAELYGSKLVAALDRQHSRDIFDVLHCYEMFGLRGDFVDCFVGYLAGHNRPTHEVLFPRQKDLAESYGEFVGMTTEEVSIGSLIAVQERLHKELPAALTQAHRDFLISFVRAEPDWSLMPAFPHLKDMPAIRWKLHNLTKLRDDKDARFAEQEKLLRERFVSLDAATTAS
ncbi:nucleotidyl transferase AbiEii/AbiGii toxin family protein [Cupriavidus sp. UYPR2.512]|uniref:nucleotidyl transferase AbiEii/AbiGii toxin family protein n=1 Tax=Cupriavidus sp. UYPR2.512 TaxID=1080187 RepID=UPI0003820959|nr:nucleotidyl transferase AbiEii/AbiGii toxin family protein [Cupriavidus sp. UYPR2.512]